MSPGLLPALHPPSFTPAYCLVPRQATRAYAETTLAQAEYPTITTILCDLDGTLVDSRRDIAVAFQHAWRTLIDASPPSASAIAQHIGRSLTDMLCAFRDPPSPTLATAFLAAYRHMYAQQDSCLTQLYPGVVETLQALSSFTRGIVTTKEPTAAQMVVRRLGLTRFFQHIQGSTWELRLKPAPDTVLAALAALHSTAAQTLMVGDSPADIMAGQAAGVLTCAVTYGYGRREALSDCRPDYMIDVFSELLPLVQAAKGRTGRSCL
jgi:phosphoglycolate phosphatase